MCALLALQVCCMHCLCSRNQTRLSNKFLTKFPIKQLISSGQRVL
uniref:Uncharacterized protein n=1 Tax=Arundo donax TaxID=35708 RepID=A0A0A9C1F5_ARUDO